MEIKSSGIGAELEKDPFKCVEMRELNVTRKDSLDMSFENPKEKQVYPKK